MVLTMFKFSITKWLEKNHAKAVTFAKRNNLGYYQQSYIATRSACNDCHKPLQDTLNRADSLECGCSFWQYSNELFRYVKTESKINEQDSPKLGATTSVR